MGGTSYHMTSMEVEEAVMAVTLDGGLAGATNNAYHYKSNLKIYMWKRGRLKG